MPLNIVLADDDPDYHDLFRHVLNETGHESTLVSIENGEELLFYLGENQTSLPGIIFLDINMPRKNGKECLREMRSHHSLLQIPVVMFSASNYHRDIDETHDLGANLYVTKLVFFNDPVKILREILTIDWKDYFPRPPKEKYLVKQ